jgi:LPXTG-motif cell wall-anchored protein
MSRNLPSSASGYDEAPMLQLIVPLATTGFHIGGSPWGLILLIALAGLGYWFVRRRRDRHARDQEQDRDQNRDRHDDR